MEKKVKGVRAAKVRMQSHLLCFCTIPPSHLNWTISPLRHQYLFLGEALEEHKLCVQVSRQLAYWIKTTRCWLSWPLAWLFPAYCPISPHSLPKMEIPYFWTLPVLSGDRCPPRSWGWVSWPGDAAGWWWVLTGLNRLLLLPDVLSSLFRMELLPWIVTGCLALIFVLKLFSVFFC